MNMPICNQCNSSFPNRLKVDGVLKPAYRRKYCLECSPWGSFNQNNHGNPKKKSEPKENYRNRQNKRRRAIKLKCVEYLGGKCVECGYDACHAALEFHHKDPAQKTMPMDAANLCSNTWEKVLAELDKCALLCANCHREVTAGFRILQKGLVRVEEEG